MITFQRVCLWLYPSSYSLRVVRNYNEVGDASVEKEIEVSKGSTLRTVSITQFSSELSKWRTIKNKYNSSDLRSTSTSNEYIGNKWSELSIENIGFNDLNILINEEDSQNGNNDMLAYFMVDGFIEGEFLISEYATEEGSVLSFKNRVFENESFAVLFKDNGDIEVRNSSMLRGGWENFVSDLETSGELIAECLIDAYGKHGWKSVALSVGSILFSKYVGLATVASCVARNLGGSNMNPIF